MITDPVEGVLVAQLRRVAGVQHVYITPCRDGVDTVYVQLEALAAHLPDEAAAQLEDALYHELVQVIAEQKRPYAWCGAGLLAPEPNTGARPLYLTPAARA